MLKIIWCLVCGFLLTSSEKCGEEPSSLPSNYWKEMVPKFINNRPMIGIAAMETMGLKMLSEVWWSNNKNYFAASFVKFVESAGGRAVPVLEDIKRADLERLLHKLNGFILPGGDADVSDSGYARVAKQVVQFSKRMAKKGIKFPVIGICRGAQVIILGEAKKDFLVETDAQNISMSLHFSKEAKHSRLYGHASKGLMKALATRSLTMNAHANGIPTASFYNNTHLMKEFRVISTNYDRNGTNFISTYEGRHAPLYGFQWHPEKSSFIFNPVLAVDHSAYSIISTQYIANFFMAEAKMNPGKFRDREDEAEHHIGSQSTPSFLFNMTETPYDQVYLFDFEKPFLYSESEDEKKKKKK